MEVFRLFGSIFIDTNAAEESLKKIGESAETIGSKFDAAGQKISNIGQTMTVSLTAPLTALGTAAVKTTADFESAMSEVAAISGATGEDFKKLEAKALEMGESTKFSASESAEALKYMAMAGWKTEDMLNGLEGIMNLAAASGEELGTTSDIVTDALTAFGLTAADSGHFADILATASSNANTNVYMMGETFKYVAPVAGAMGYSAEDVALAVGLMANSSIKASQAGTSLRSALTNLANPTDAMAAAMSNLGLIVEETAVTISEGDLLKAQEKVEAKTIAMEKAQIKYNDAVSKYGESSSQAQIAALNLQTAQNNLESATAALAQVEAGEVQIVSTRNDLLTDSEGNMRSLYDVLVILREKFADLSQEEQIQAAATIFGKEAMSGMLAIINATEADFNKLTGAIQDCEGSTQEMADAMNDNLSGQITLLKSQLEGIAIQFGTIILPYVKQFVEWLSKVCDWIASLDEGTQKMIITVAALLAAVGPVLIFVGKVVSGIGSIISIGGKLVTGTASVITALQKFATVGSAIIAGIAKVCTFIGSTVLPAIGSVIVPIAAVTAAVAAVIAIGKLLYDNWDSIAAFAGDCWDGIKNAIGNAVDGIIGFFGDLFDGFASVFQAIGESFSEAQENFSKSFSEIKESVSQSFREAKDNVVNTVSELASNVGDWFQKIGQNISNSVSEAIENAGNAVKNFQKSVSDSVTHIKEQAVEAFRSMGQSISTAVSELGQSVFNTFTALKDNIQQTLENVGNKAFEIFSNVRDSVSQKVKELTSSIVDNFTALSSSVSEKVRNLFDSVTNIFSNIGTFASDIFGNSAKTMIDAFLSIPDKVKAIVENIKNLFKFEWKLPSIKLPHFSIDGGFSLNPPSIPKIGVEWYAEGGIMKNPTAFGYNPFTGKVMAGGEAGEEAIAPITLLQDYVREAVQERDDRLYTVLNLIYEQLSSYLPEVASRQLILDTGAVVGSLASGMNTQLGSISKRNDRIR